MPRKLEQCNTHSDESMKYIPRAPILRAKTNTTLRKKRKISLGFPNGTSNNHAQGAKNKVNHSTLVEMSVKSRTCSPINTSHQLLMKKDADESLLNCLQQNTEVFQVCEPFRIVYISA